jgi:F-type H+-transporting ATPase subunit b
MTEHAAGHPSPADLFWPAANFILFVGLLVYVLRRPVAEYFRERTTRLREALRAGARARAEAEALRATLARDMERLPTIRAELLADMRAAAEFQRDKLIASGRAAADRIRTDARLVAEQEAAAARQTLRAELIESAMGEASMLVRRALEPQDQERFVRDFVGALR